MNSPQRDPLPPEWLAAYADGELTEEQRAQVEQWLSENPEAREILEVQEALGPANVELWDASRAPGPSPRQWQATVDRVADQTRIGVSRSWYGWVASLALAATAAGLLFFLPGRQVNIEPITNGNEEQAFASAAEDEPVLMASNDDVQIVSLPEDAADLLLVGIHPLQELRLELAKAGEIEFFGVGSDLAGNFPEMPAKDSLANDVPILWAPRGP